MHLSQAQQLQGTNAKENTRLFAQLRAHGLRPTSARVWILQVLLDAAHSSLSAERVFQQISKHGVRVSLATIYRVLQELVQCKLAQREWHVVDSLGKSLYLVAPAVLPPSSYAFACRICQRQIVVADRQLNDHLHRQAKAADFEL